MDDSSEIDHDKLRNAIASSFPTLKITTLEWNEKGWDNIIALVNGKTVFRIPRNTESEAQLEREIRLLSLLEKCPARIPQYRYVSRIHGLIGGYRYIQGEPLNSAGTLGGSLLRSMVVFLEWLHTYDVDSIRSAGLSMYTPGGWLKRQENVISEFQSNLSDFLKDGVFRSILERLNSVLDGIPEESISLVHGDLYRGNVIISTDHDRIDGVIDWGDAFVGDMALDIAALGLDFGRRGTIDLLESGIASHDPHIAERVLFYQDVEPLYYAEYLTRTGRGMDAKKVCESVKGRFMD